jgi:hypothetical protein
VPGRSVSSSSTAIETPTLRAMSRQRSSSRCPVGSSRRTFPSGSGHFDEIERCPRMQQRRNRETGEHPARRYRGSPADKVERHLQQQWGRHDRDRDDDGAEREVVRRAIVGGG